MNDELKGYTCNVDTKVDIKKQLKKIKENNRKKFYRNMAVLTVANSIVLVGSVVLNSEKMLNKIDDRIDELDNKLFMWNLEKQGIIGSNETLYNTFETNNEYYQKDSALSFSMYQSNKVYNNITFELNNLIGSMDSYSEHVIYTFMESSYGEKIISACIKYNCDIATIFSIGLVEFSLNENYLYRILDGEEIFNPFQFDTIDEKVFFKDTNLEIKRDFETITNPETHFDIAVANIKTLMTKYNNNPNLFIPAYNMGEGITNLVISKIMDEYNMSYIEVLNCMDNTMFSMEYKLISSDCSNYYLTCSNSVQESNKTTLNYLANWEYNSYGDGDYLDKFYTYYLTEYGSLFDNYNVLNEFTQSLSR